MLRRYINRLLYGYFRASVPVVHRDMADIPVTPNLSQRPHSFHPDYDREVFSVVFSVGQISSLAHLDHQF